jgi:hypothetical protein
MGVINFFQNIHPEKILHLVRNRHYSQLVFTQSDAGADRLIDTPFAARLVSMSPFHLLGSSLNPAAVRENRAPWSGSGKDVDHGSFSGYDFGR